MEGQKWRWIECTTSPKLGRGYTKSGANAGIWECYEFSIAISINLFGCLARLLDISRIWLSFASSVCAAAHVHSTGKYTSSLWFILSNIDQFFQTFYQAKLLQIIIMMAGIVHIVKEQNTAPMFSRRNWNKKKIIQVKEKTWKW